MNARELATRIRVALNTLDDAVTRGHRAQEELERLIGILEKDPDRQVLMFNEFETRRETDG